jgi:hypothetical protein
MSLEDLKQMAQESHIILKRVDERTDLHGKELRFIREGMANVALIAENTGKMANTLERVTDRAMSALENKSTRDNKFNNLVVVMLGLLLIVAIVSWFKGDFSASIKTDGATFHAGPGGK